MKNYVFKIIGYDFRVGISFEREKRRKMRVEADEMCG